MADSFVRADETSRGVRDGVRVDQTVLTAAILNLAINARNTMPNGARNSRHRRWWCSQRTANDHIVRAAYGGAYVGDRRALLQRIPVIWKHILNAW